MIEVLRQGELVVPVAGVIRKTVVSEQAFHRWKAKYVGLEVEWIRPDDAVAGKKPQLKLLVADWMLGRAMLQDGLAKNW